MPLVLNAQSDSLKAAYKQVSETLRDYKFVSEDVFLSGIKRATSSITLVIRDGYYIFSIVDDFKGSWSTADYRDGTKILKTAISSTDFGWSVSQGYYIDEYDERIAPDEEYKYRTYLYNTNGIELTHRDKKELLKIYRIHGTELTVEKLEKELNILSRIAKGEKFTGSLGIMGTSAKNTTQSTTKPKQSNQTPQRKRVPAGN